VISAAEVGPSEAEAAIDRSLALDPNWAIALTWKATLTARRLRALAQERRRFGYRRSRQLGRECRL
jgi:hypothetical protein